MDQSTPVTAIYIPDLYYNTGHPIGVEELQEAKKRASAWDKNNWTWDTRPDMSPKDKRVLEAFVALAAEHLHQFQLALGAWQRSTAPGRVDLALKAISRILDRLKPFKTQP